MEDEFSANNLTRFDTGDYFTALKSAVRDVEIDIKNCDLDFVVGSCELVINKTNDLIDCLKKLKSREMYNILESRIEFKNNKLFRITVLVEFSLGDVRAIYADTRERSGYLALRPHQEITNKLLQEVAGYGSERRDKDDMFPGWHSKLTELRNAQRHVEND